MKSEQKFITTSNYVQIVKPHLPSEAFLPAPQKIATLFIHLSVVLIGYVAIRLLSPMWWPFCTLIIGHSLSCIAFLAHELSHNIIIREPRLRYILELLFWCINLIPPTLWKRVHNQTHASTLNDPDRAFLINERSLLTRLYSRLFYPHRQNWRWNPLIGFHFVPYIFRNLLAVFYTKHSKPTIVPYKPAFSSKQRSQITAELIIVALGQIGIFYYLWAGPVAYLVVSSVVMFYVFTNHFLNPLSEHSDPLIGTTSVIVPKLLNQLHNNFSYHTEHHLFPTMNSDYYDHVSKILQNQYKDRYHQLPISEAWRQLWDGDEFVNSNKPFTKNNLDS